MQMISSLRILEEKCMLDAQKKKNGKETPTIETNGIYWEYSTILVELTHIT